MSDARLELLASAVTMAIAVGTTLRLVAIVHRGDPMRWGRRGSVAERPPVSTSSAFAMAWVFGCSALIFLFAAFERNDLASRALQGALLGFLGVFAGAIRDHVRHARAKRNDPRHGGPIG